jgi:hypothetical protein
VVDTHKLAGLVLSGLIGAGVGWAAQALTLAGRVTALEQGQAQIVDRLDRLILKAENNGR